MRVAALVVVVGAFAGTGCLGYTSALGFRARQAVMANDVEAFRDLMEEAADTTPAGPRDNPKKTVLTHFLDLAADSRFFPYIEEWRAQGWVEPDMICSIHRAHYRAVRESDPDAAWRSVEVCLNTAREAAAEAEKSWQVADCLEDASFLTQTATAALVPFLKLVADGTEPLRFRVGLLDGMTRIWVHSTQRRLDNEPTLSREEAAKQAEQQVENVRRRFEWILAAARPFTDVTILAAGTAFGAMELEEASIALGRSYVGKYALSENPEDVDLAWAWIRAMKNKKKVPELQSLGLWNRDKETKDDVYWYICSKDAPIQAVEGTPAAALGPMSVIDAITVRLKDKPADPETIRAEHCKEKKDGDPYPAIVGPFPSESSARGSVAAQKTANEKRADARTSVVLKRRIVL